MMAPLCAHRPTKYIGKITHRHSKHLLKKLQKLRGVIFSAASCSVSYNIAITRETLNSH